jgi:RNA-splicing ligase RtcB
MAKASIVKRIRTMLSGKAAGKQKQHSAEPLLRTPLSEISLICSGKGNADWNCSAPHGAGRLMSRKDAFASLSMEEYRQEMAGIYTTCIDRATLDEAPMAYKSMEEIVAQIGPTAEIVERIRPVYNFKAAD